MEAATATGTRWRSVLVLEGVETDDGRLIDPGALDWRDLPLSLMAMDTTSAGGHEGARLAGRIDSIARNAMTGEVIGEGVFDSEGEFGAEILRQVRGEMLTGVSVDLAIREYELRQSGQVIEDPYEASEDERVIFAVTDASIMGATVCPFPAFADASIELLADGGTVRVMMSRIELLADDAPTLALAAAGAPLHPPASWFDDPALDGPTALEVTSDGRVYGHAALWDSCHIANPHGAGVCVTPPRSGSGYAYFHLGQVETEEGGYVAVGQITLDAPHAPLKASLADATRHYDHTGVATADVRVGEDLFGIWVAGAVRPDVEPEKVRALAAAKISGDWRGMRGRLELVGLLAVNVPGFPVPRVSARVAAGAVAEEVEDDRLALVAAGIVDEPGMVLSPEAMARSIKVMAARARGGVEGLTTLARGQ